MAFGCKKVEEKQPTLADLEEQRSALIDWMGRDRHPDDARRLAQLDAQIETLKTPFNAAAKATDTATQRPTFGQRAPGLFRRP